MKIHVAVTTGPGDEPVRLPVRPGLASALLVLGLAACVSPPAGPLAGYPAASAGSSCEAVAARRIAFSSRKDADLLEVRAAGADCPGATVTVTVRLPDGAPAFEFAMPLTDLHGVIDRTKPLTPDKLAATLRAYVDAAQIDPRSSTLPAWTGNSPTPGFDQGLELTSPLSRERYAALRKARPNLLCLRDAQESFSCHVWDRKRQRAEVILQH